LWSCKAYEHGLAIDQKYVQGTAAELYRLSKTIKQWDTRELEQLVSAAKMGYPVYVQMYNEIYDKQIYGGR
jgi:cytolysin (calcineurin-like family phosphatase)